MTRVPKIARTPEIGAPPLIPERKSRLPGWLRAIIEFVGQAIGVIV